MRLTAHEWFINWYGSEKRRLSDEEIAWPAVGANSADT